MAFIPKTSTFSLEKKSSFIFNLTLPQSTAYPLSINFGWTILLISFPFIFLHYHPLTQQQLPFPTMTVTTGTNHCEQYSFSTKRYNRSMHPPCTAISDLFTFNKTSHGRRLRQQHNPLDTVSSSYPTS